jgi:hypothetical protein
MTEAQSGVSWSVEAGMVEEQNWKIEKTLKKIEILEMVKLESVGFWLLLAFCVEKLDWPAA